MRVFFKVLLAVFLFALMVGFHHYWFDIQFGRGVIMSVLDGIVIGLMGFYMQIVCEKLL